MPAETHNECCAKDEFTLCLKTIVELYLYIIKDLLLRTESVVIVTERHHGVLIYIQWRTYLLIRFTVQYFLWLGGVL